ncbi:MAG: ATP-binding protein [Dinoroseobacter sp.]|nr:ATP-binding protein [Dinoroseobacter sp.]
MLKNHSRFALPTAILVLVVFIAILGRNLWLDLRALSTAGNENAQWTILQLDTEFANLQSTLLDQTSRPQPDLETIRLRTDITLSRVDLVGRGNALEIISSDEQASELLAQVRLFSERADRLLEGEITNEDLAQLLELTSQTRPLARELALIGISRGAERTEDRRRAFSVKLRNTSFVAIAVILALAALLVVLNRLLWIARERDIALRASSARLASTVSASLDAIIIADGTGRIEEVNEAAESILGWKKGDLIGKPIQNSILPALGQKANRRVTSVPHDSDLSELIGKGRLEIQGVRRTGEPFPAEVSVTSVSDTENDLVVIYLRDISVEKINEKTLRDAKEKAERTDRAKSQFLAIMSHELRTPLNGILGVLDLLKTTNLSRKQLYYLDVAAGSGELMREQVNEALDATRIETNSLVLSPRVFNLSEMVAKAVSVLEPLAIQKGLDLAVEVEPSMQIDFVADENRIGQMLTNLVGNAIKFTQIGGVRVSVEGVHATDTTLASITVSDSGDGIPVEKIEAVFEDFVVLTSPQGRLSRGDGLGLPISRKIARLMGGDITARSTEGVGSTFVLRLPLNRASHPSTKLAPEAQVRRELFAPLQGRLDVLVVEDNDINSTVLEEMLTGMGHSVVCAKNAREGFDAAMRRPFNIILMDISLPDTDGIELTRQIREAVGPNRQTAIHGLTAYGEDEYFRTAMAAGMDGFSTKPIRIYDLARILQGEPAETEAATSSADLVDEAVFNELLDALGRSQLNDSLTQFFDEMSDFLFEIEDPMTSEDFGEIAKQLHKLRGAAALFGLRTLAAGIEAASKKAETQSVKSFKVATARLNGLCNDTNQRLGDLNSVQADTDQEVTRSE